MVLSPDAIKWGAEMAERVAALFSASGWDGQM